MGFVAETSYNGIYAITKESITRYDRKGESESQGLLVRKHYDEIQNALLVAGIMKEGSTLLNSSCYKLRGNIPLGLAGKRCFCYNQFTIHMRSAPTGHSGNV